MRVVDRRSALGGFALGVVATLAAVVGVSGLPSAEAERRPRLTRAAFDGAVDDMLDRYVEPVDESELLARGLRGMAEGLDAHSHYMTADERKQLRARAGQGSIGCAAMLHREGPRRWLEVVAVMPGSPSDKAGLRPGDHILRVGDREVAELDHQAEVDAMLAGPIGEELALSIQHAKASRPADVTVEFSSHRSDSVHGRLLSTSGGFKVAHIRIRAFTGGSGDKVKRTLASLRRSAGKAGVGAVILDLRANPGGQVDEALVVADLFVKDGVLTRTRGRGGRILREEKAHAKGTDSSTKLVVLQDRHSASAAELLAVALKDHGRAQIVGERSYGKGTVQKIMGLKDGSALTLTIARYHSPDDRLIDGVGVSPDVHVVLDAGDDARALQAALDVLGVQQRR